MDTEPPSLLERKLAGRLVRTVFLRDRRGGPWPAPASPPSQPITFEGNTRARVKGRWFPHARPRGTVVLAHPDRRYAGHWFVREGWVEFLHAHRYEVLTFDFTGYGESRGPATYYHEDVLAAAHVARERSGGRPVSVVGLSMGAFAAANASPRLDFVRALVLESPYPSFNAWYGGGPALWAMRAFDRLFPRSSAAIQADRHIAHAAPERILIALAEDDTVTPPALTEAVARAAPRDRTTLLRLPGVRHLEAFGRSEPYRRAVLDAIA